MFPDEETREIILTGEASIGTSRYETSKLTQPIENIIKSHIGKEVIGFRNEIAKSRRGSAVKENTFRMRIEIPPREIRQKSADDIIKSFKEEFIEKGVVSKNLFQDKSDLKNLKSDEDNEKLNDKSILTSLKFSKSWHGQSSGSPIEIIIKENDDNIRQKVAFELESIMKNENYLENVEVEKPITHTEYHIKLDRDKVRRLAINPSDIAQTLRASLEGTILYEFSGKDETFYVRLTIFEKAKDDINKILNLPIENESKYLVPLKDITTITKALTPDSILREDQKRVLKIFADIKKNKKNTS